MICSRLDDMVEEVLTVKRATITTIEAENEKQAVTMKACVALLDASSDYYENLVLLHDELRQRDRREDRPSRHRSERAPCSILILGTRRERISRSQK
ncbi:unnamed protein product, partial [Iphiclides podalirius]